MSQPAAASALDLDVNRAALRLVLFGMPDAGKSSLLGALGQAAQVQEHLLNGHLTDLSQGLEELERRLYEQTPRETLEEVAPYPVAFEPFGLPNQGSRPGRFEVVLVDCDGRVANELLSRRRNLNEHHEDKSLARAILEADALILAVDASVPMSQIEANFVEFGRFLRLLEHSRGQRTDVGGLPVFLVLTKCDLLARAGDTPAAWMERIEERKRQVGGRFQEFLARERGQGPTPFGRVDLHVWATAVKRPAMEGSQAKPREPFGVAELFRQGFEGARGFRRRREKSGRLLFWIVAMTIGLVAALVAVIVFGVNWSLTHQEPRVSELEIKVKNYQASEGQTPAERLSGDLHRKIARLIELEKNPEFNNLPQDLKDYVHDRRQELDRYNDYRAKLAHLHLADVEREADLDQLEARLTGDLAIPEPYRQDWTATEAGLLHAKLLNHINGLRQAVAETEEWYHRRLHEGEELRTFARNKPSDASTWDDWQKRVQDLVKQRPPHPESEEVDATAVTYATVYGMDNVGQVQNDWKTLQQRLEGLRDLIAALGLAGRLPEGERQPLDIPDGFSLDQARPYRERLEKLYPGLPKEVAKIEFPDALAEELHQDVQVRYDRLIEAGRNVVLQHLQQLSPDGRETPERWRSLRQWLDSPEELRDWRVPADLLAGLQSAGGKDPIAVLADFLQKERFELQLQRLDLEVPYDLKGRPVGSLAIHFHRPNEAEAQLVFKLLDEEGRRDPQRRVTKYTLVPESVNSLTYHPGDLLWAELPVKKEGEDGDWLFTWSQCRSDTYQFERLVRSPRLHRRDQVATEGNIAEGVAMTVTPAGGVPPLPDLLPVVKLEKR